MDKFHNEIPKLISVSYYRAPKVHSVNPSTIPVGIEYVELIINGVVFFRPDDSKSEHAFSCGAMFWHTAGDHTVHKTTPESPYECLCLRYDTSRLNRNNRLFPRLTEWENKDEAVTFANSVINAFHGGTICRTLLSAYTYTKIAWEAENFRLKLHSHLMPKQLQNLLSFIELNFMGNIVLKDMADAAGISSSHLHLLCRKYLKKTPHKILLEKRLSEAKKRIITSNDPIKEISSSCGFLNIESFYRAYQKRYKTSPAKSRKENEQNRYFK